MFNDCLGRPKLVEKLLLLFFSHIKKKHFTLAMANATVAMPREKGMVPLVQLSINLRIDYWFF
jgi:hypothetical protein